MKSVSKFMGACVTIASLAASAVSAQDTFNYDWEGPYVGAFIAGSFFEVELSDITDNITNDSPATNALVPAGGINGGYNWIPRNDNLLLGAELEIQGGHATDQIVRFNAEGTSGRLFESSVTSITSLKGRVGLINDNLLVYMSGGPAWANVDYNAILLDASKPQDCSQIICAEASEQLLGLTVGAGMEYAIRDSMTLRFEIAHISLPTASADIVNAEETNVCSTAAADDCAAFFSSSSTQIQFGLNYNF
jgi:opacity protein-like surface antigen